MVHKQYATIYSTNSRAIGGLCFIIIVTTKREMLSQLFDVFHDFGNGKILIMKTAPPLNNFFIFYNRAILYTLLILKLNRNVYEDRKKPRTLTIKICPFTNCNFKVHSKPCKNVLTRKVEWNITRIHKFSRQR